MTTEIAFERAPVHTLNDQLEIQINGRDCVSVRTRDGANVEINRVPYTLTAILYLDDGEWGVGHKYTDANTFDGSTREQTGWARWYGSLWGNRTDKGILGDTFTNSARAIAVKIAEDHARAWIEENPEALADGDRVNREQRTRQLLAEVNKLQSQIDTLNAEIDTLR